MLFAVVYRPPKYNKSFIQDFEKFLSSILVTYDKCLMPVLASSAFQLLLNML